MGISEGGGVRDLGFGVFGCGGFSFLVLGKFLAGLGKRFRNLVLEGWYKYNGISGWIFFNFLEIWFNFCMGSKIRYKYFKIGS